MIEEYETLKAEAHKADAAAAAAASGVAGKIIGFLKIAIEFWKFCSFIGVDEMRSRKPNQKEKKPSYVSPDTKYTRKAGPIQWNRFVKSRYMTIKPKPKPEDIPKALNKKKPRSMSK